MSGGESLKLTPTIRRAVVATVLVCAAAALLAATAAAGTLETRREEAARVAADVAVLDARLDVAVAGYARAAQQLAALESRIAANRREMSATRAQLTIAEQQLSLRAEALYKQGTTSFLDALMGTASFDELLARAEYFRRVGRSDAEIVDSVSRYREGIESRHRQLEADLAKAEKVAAASAERRAEIETALRERRAMLVGIRAQVERLKDAAAVRARAEATGGTSGPVDGAGETGGEGVWWPLIQEVASQNGISARGLYRLMMAESGGVATAVNGPYRGLFQYAGSTWRGSWNPWRGRDIFDGAAQIRATGLAIRLGHGPDWWPTAYAWAFSS